MQEIPKQQRVEETSRDFNESANKLHGQIPHLITQATETVGGIDVWQKDGEIIVFTFEFGGQTFRLFVTYRGDGYDMYSAPTADGADWDLYVDYLPVETLSRRLFHEILESYIRDQHETSDVARQTALRLEENLYGPR